MLCGVEGLVQNGRAKTILMQIRECQTESQVGILYKTENLA